MRRNVTVGTRRLLKAEFAGITRVGWREQENNFKKGGVFCLDRHQQRHEKLPGFCLGQKKTNPQFVGQRRLNACRPCHHMKCWSVNFVISMLSYNDSG